MEKHILFLNRRNQHKKGANLHSLIHNFILILVKILAILLTKEANLKVYIKI